MQHESMPYEHEAAPRGDLRMSDLEEGVPELLHPSAPKADEMIVLWAIGQLEHGAMDTEHAARQQTDSFQLRQRAVDRPESQFSPLVHQAPINLLRTQMTQRACADEFEDLESRQRWVQTRAPKKREFGETLRLD